MIRTTLAATALYIAATLPAAVSADTASDEAAILADIALHRQLNR